MQMLIDTKPKYFSDQQLRIAGLLPMVRDVARNAQTLIQEAGNDSDSVCTRDDIMIYLIQQGLEEGLAAYDHGGGPAGKGLARVEEEMTKHGVPDCEVSGRKKIKYIFLKAQWRRML